MPRSAREEVLPLCAHEGSVLAPGDKERASREERARSGLPSRAEEWAFFAPLPRRTPHEGCAAKVRDGSAG
jgi:hypothetical protein